MEDIAILLDRFDISEYTDRFLAEGFDTWNVVRDITDTDLTFLGVSLAHKRRLQQEILAAWNPRSPRSSLSRKADYAIFSLPIIGRGLYYY
jgi:hypothetical protein